MGGKGGNDAPPQQDMYQQPKTVQQYNVTQEQQKAAANRGLQQMVQPVIDTTVPGTANYQPQQKTQPQPNLTGLGDQLIAGLPGASRLEPDQPGGAYSNAALQRALQTTGGGQGGGGMMPTYDVMLGTAGMQNSPGSM